jgi:sorting nexin-4
VSSLTILYGEVNMWKDYEDPDEDGWEDTRVDERPPRDGASDVTYPASTPSTPTSTKPPSSPVLPLEDILDDPEYDQISDCEEVVKEEAYWRGDPTAVRRRAMAEDFEKEGKLETLVDSPQKENPGTQNQYISYLVTTKVYTARRPHLHSHTHAA